MAKKIRAKKTLDIPKLLNLVQRHIAPAILISGISIYIIFFTTVLSNLFVNIYEFFIASPYKLLNFNLGVDFVQYISLIFVTGLILYLFFALVVYLYGIFGKKFNYWWWYTFLIMAGLLVTGIYIIDLQFGNHDITLVLRDRDANFSISGLLNCTDDNDHLLYVNELITCHIAKPGLENTSVTVFFTYENESSDSILYTLANSNSFNFLARTNVMYVGFDVSGYDENNTKRNLTISNKYKFLTNELYEEKKKNFTSALLVLITIIFFSVPSAVNSLKNLYRNK